MKKKKNEDTFTCAASTRHNHKLYSTNNQKLEDEKKNQQHINKYFLLNKIFIRFHDHRTRYL